MTDANMTSEAGERKSLTVHIGDTEVPVITFQGGRVLTTELLARVYGTEEENVRKNFSRNAERFIEGVHYVKASGKTLDDLRVSYGHAQISPKTRTLTLWTDRGAARHAKMLETGAAWQVFGQLEEAYFESKVPEPQIARRAAFKEAAGIFRDAYGIGRLIGYDKNQASIHANAAARNITGVDVLAAMTAPAIEAPRQDVPMTPTELGKEIGLSAKQVNQALYRAGFQEPDGKGGWMPTEKGLPHARLFDAAKKHSAGSVAQWKWFRSVLDALGEDVNAAGVKIDPVH